MPRGSIGPGDDVEAWCTRCRMNLNHRVIAVVGNSIQRVHCLTCGGDHKYYPPKRGQDADSGKRPARGVASEKTRRPIANKSPGRAESEWATFMKDLPADGHVRLYELSETYTPGEFIEHPNFGRGRVIDIVGAEKFQVIFKEGRKILLFNRKKTD
ncbi:MAG TPA: hypothetical protein VK463_05130 [Desulfomonilaceae bacterium]|nr:hypothetical protein [Desulfomonilaceae bacterium]